MFSRHVLIVGVTAFVKWFFFKSWAHFYIGLSFYESDLRRPLAILNARPSSCVCTAGIFSQGTACLSIPLAELFLLLLLLVGVFNFFVFSAFLAAPPAPRPNFLLISYFLSPLGILVTHTPNIVPRVTGALSILLQYFSYYLDWLNATQHLQVHQPFLPPSLTCY